MTAECLRCAVRDQPSRSWRATGRFITRIGRDRFMCAELVCARCGNVWTSGCIDAVDAGQTVRVERGDEPYTLGEVDEATPTERIAQTVRVPAPTLFGALPPRSQGFVPVGRTAKRMTVEEAARLIARPDAKQRQAGGDE